MTSEEIAELDEQIRALKPELYMSTLQVCYTKTRIST